MKSRILNRNYNKQTKNELFKSWLFLPANNNKFISNIDKIPADIFVLDLEDSIIAKNKDSARNNLKEVINNHPNNKELSVRINNINSKWGVEDLHYILECGFNRIVYPKIKDSQELTQINKFITDCGINRKIELIPIIESIEAYVNLDNILENSNTSNYIIFGSEDFLTEFPVLERNFVFNNKVLENTIFNLSIKCKHYNKILIDCACPFFGVDDKNNFYNECIASRDLGVSGKLAIHPNQVTIINKVFGEQINYQKERLLERVETLLNKIDITNNSIVKNNDTISGIPELRKINNYLKLILSINNEENGNEIEEIIIKINIFLENA